MTTPRKEAVKCEGIAFVMPTCAQVKDAREGARVILMGLRGSHAHGTFIPPGEPTGTDDVDTFAVWAWPASHYTEVSTYGNSKRDGFETGGGDLDIAAYDIRKFLWLLRVGNPNVHSWLWSDALYATSEGIALTEQRVNLLTPKLYTATAGYASAQLRKMFKASKSGYMGAKREALLARYGYDIKNAAHCVRLLYLGLTLAREHRLRVKLTGEQLSTVLGIKRGEWTSGAVEKLAIELFAEFNGARSKPEATIPEPPLGLYDTLAHKIICGPDGKLFEKREDGDATNL